MNAGTYDNILKTSNDKNIEAITKKADERKGKTAPAVDEKVKVEEVAEPKISGDTVKEAFSKVPEKEAAKAT